MKYWNYIPQITGFQYSYLIGHNINEINNISEMNITLTVCVCIHSTFDCNNQYFQAFKYIATLLILSGPWFLSKNLYTKFLRIKLNLSSHLNIVCLKKKNEDSVVSYYYKKDFEDLESIVFFQVRLLRNFY